MAMQIVLGVKEVYYEIVQVENRGFVLRVYIFAHLHTALRTEENMLDMNWLRAAKELVKLNTRWKF